MRLHARHAVIRFEQHQIQLAAANLKYFSTQGIKDLARLFHVYESFGRRLLGEMCQKLVICASSTWAAIQVVCLAST